MSKPAHICAHIPFPQKIFKLKFNHITVTYCIHYLAENSVLPNSNLKTTGSPFLPQFLIKIFAQKLVAKIYT